MKQHIAHVIKTNKFPPFICRLARFSDWYCAKRATAVLLRLQSRYRHGIALNANNVGPVKGKNKFTYTPVTMQDLQLAEAEIIKLVQRDAFSEELEALTSLRSSSGTANCEAKRNKGLPQFSPLCKLDPFVDEAGILRVGGRIRNVELCTHSKHPAILPKCGHITDLIVCYYHRSVQHQIRGITLNEIRSCGFWIIGGTSVVSKHISKCVKCRRLRGVLQGQKMADLPNDRLEPAPPFTYSAVDHFGPWYVKEGRRELKRYGVLFTCMSSRAIHLEVAHTLNTDSFINLLSVTDGISRLTLSTLNCNQRLLPFADFKSSSLAGINVNRSLLL